MHCNEEMLTYSKVFDFLAELPADENLLASVASTSTSYRDLFPLGQPFRSLYALYALDKYLVRRESEESPPDGREEPGTATASAKFPEALSRAMSLVVSAIEDREVIVQCPTYEVQVNLSAALIDRYLRLLKSKATCLELLGNALTRSQTNPYRRHPSTPWMAVILTAYWTSWR